MQHSFANPAMGSHFWSVLWRFVESARTVLHSDASWHSLGAALLQGNDSSSDRVVAYASGPLTPAEQNYMIREKEFLTSKDGIK